MRLFDIFSGVTPIGQGWTNARGPRGLGAPSLTLTFCIFQYLNFEVFGVSHLLHPTADFFIIVLCLMVILVNTLITSTAGTMDAGSMVAPSGE